MTYVLATDDTLAAALNKGGVEAYQIPNPVLLDHLAEAIGRPAALIISDSNNHSHLGLFLQALVRWPTLHVIYVVDRLEQMPNGPAVTKEVCVLRPFRTEVLVEKIRCLLAEV